jgi:acid phosphatase
MRSTSAAASFFPVLTWAGIALTSICHMHVQAAPINAAESVQGHINFNSTLWYQTSAEFRANSIQTYNTAVAMLAAAKADKNWTALTNQTSNFAQLPPAIIVDIDETILDNSPAAVKAIEKNSGFDMTIWTDWVQKASAKEVPGAVNFVNKAQDMGIKVLFISNRECNKPALDACPAHAATLKNLKAVGIKHIEAEQLWLKNQQADWTSEKESRRIKAANSYRVVMLVGDDFGDFLPNVKKDITPAQRAALVDKYQDFWGTRWFMLTNPTYGSWDTILKSPKAGYLTSF